MYNEFEVNRLIFKKAESLYAMTLSASIPNSSPRLYMLSSVSKRGGCDPDKAKSTFLHE
jgi:hypothetical protein